MTRLRVRSPQGEVIVLVRGERRGCVRVRYLTGPNRGRVCTRAVGWWRHLLDVMGLS